MPSTAPRAAARAPTARLRDPAGRAERETARLYAEFGPRIYRHCLGQLRLHEDAEDAVQNTFLRVYTALGRGIAPEFEAPWLYKIAHNVCLSRRLGATRRARVETPRDLSELEGRTAGLQHVHDELFGLDDALAAMPPRLRRAILLREWQGLSYAEIADTLSISQSAVETLIFRARRHLAHALERTVAKPVRRSASALNAGPLIGAAKTLLGGVGAAKLAAGAAVLAVALVGGVEAERAVHRHISAHAVERGPSPGSAGLPSLLSAFAGPDWAGTRGPSNAQPGDSATSDLFRNLGSTLPWAGGPAGGASSAPGSAASAPGALESGGGSSVAPTAPENPIGSPTPSAPDAPTSPTSSDPGATATLPPVPASSPLPTAPDPTLPDPTLPDPTLPDPTLPDPTLPDPTTTPLPTDPTTTPLPTIPTLP